MSVSIIDDLKDERLRQGISIRKMAELTGMSKSTIINIESGEVSPRIETVYTIAKVLGCEIFVRRC